MMERMTTIQSSKAKEMNGLYIMNAYYGDLKAMNNNVQIFTLNGYKYTCENVPDEVSASEIEEIKVVDVTIPLRFFAKVCLIF